MRRSHLRELPQVTLPDASYHLRKAVASDADALAKLLQLAFTELEWAVSRVRNEVLEHGSVLQTFVVEHDDRLVATASSQYLPDRFRDAGVVHWVGADPNFAGKGLGAAVTTSVLHNFIEHGRTTAVLLTDDHRLAAIRVYLKLGFLPEMSHESHPERWKAIFLTLA
jgi:mycothiol synthase